MKKIVALIVILLFVNNNLEAFAQEELPISVWDYQSMLGCGIDVDWANTNQGISNYNVKAVKAFRNMGIKHVRIRVSNDITEELLNHMQVIVNDCLDNDIIPIIAYHASDFKLNPNEETMEKTVNWWKNVAEGFKDYSHKLSFDLMIECSDELNNKPEMLNEMFERATTEIRKYNKDRIIMISPVVRSSPENLKLLKLPSQGNGYVMAQWHFYASGPSKTNVKKLWTVGTEEEKKLITDRIDIAVKWQEENNIPTWVGAWMPGNYNYENEYDVDEQVVFASFMKKALEEKNIPYAINADHKFYDRENCQWIEEMLPLMNTIFKGKAFIYGDADNSGDLTEADYLLILQKARNNDLKLPVECYSNYFSIIDVDNDSVITATDAVYILKKVLDEDFILPVEN